MPAVEQDLTQGSVTRKLVRYALPLVASSLLQAIYSITDIIIAGHYIGDVGISAINNASIIMNMLTQLAIGLTVGGNVLVGQYFGSGDHENRRKSAGNMLTEDGNVPNMDKAMLADAVATCCGAVCGTSTVTTFVESSAGVAEGGRTGLASMATAALFFIAMFLAPVAQLIPTYACAAALIYVGVLMMSNVRSIDWDDPAAAVPGFMTVAFMPLTYNISYGIAFGLISYVFIKIFTGKIKEVNRSICFNIDSHGVFSVKMRNADLIFTGYFRKFF